MENRKLVPIITYEWEPISEFVGNEKDKILFLQKFPKVAIFSKKGTTFHASGIY